MKLDWRNLRTFDKDTGKEIEHCFLADEETGEYGIIVRREDERGFLMTADHTYVVREFHHGNIEIRRIEQAHASRTDRTEDRSG